jgi:hypothetical protein
MPVINLTQHRTFHIGKQNIEIVSQFKYLGVIIDNRLNLIKQSLETKRKIYSRLNILNIISNVKVGINTNNLISFYKALIQSILLYATPINLQSTHSKKLGHESSCYSDTNETASWRDYLN